MTLKIYQYPKCGSCRKALEFLDKNNVRYEKIDITETPPSKSELNIMLQMQHGEIKKLFNTAGELYREFKMSERLSGMSDSEAIGLLSQHGKLIKRPFVLTQSSGLLGFKEESWKQALLG